MKKYKMIKPESDDCSFFGFLYLSWELRAKLVGTPFGRPLFPLQIKLPCVGGDAYIAPLVYVIIGRADVGDSLVVQGDVSRADRG